MDEITQIALLIGVAIFAISVFVIRKVLSIDAMVDNQKRIIEELRMLNSKIRIARPTGASSEQTEKEKAK